MDESSFQASEDEIQALEEEIRQLTEEYEDIRQESTFFSDEEILKAIKSLEGETQGETKGHESLSGLKAELESLERDLSFLTAFTGFHFTSHSKKTLERTKSSTMQKHRVSGTCHSLPFQVEFQLLEMPNNEKVSAVVSDLSIVMESIEDSNMSKFVSSTGRSMDLLEQVQRRMFRGLEPPLLWRQDHIKIELSNKIFDLDALCDQPSFPTETASTEERGDLLTFFRSISAYAEWCEHRRRTFLHFKAKYPDIVTLPEGLQGDFIILRNPKVAGFELMIVWKIHFDEEGTTTPVLDLLPKVPEPVLEQRMGTDSIPGCFRSAVRLLGIEAAVENLVTVLGSGQ